jgi:hypothetical protein
MLVLLSVILYGYMECVYTSRALAKACRQNINFMWLLNGNAPPSHGMINWFRKHVLGRAMEEIGCELVHYLERCGEVRFEQVFIDGTMLEAQANRHTAVWRKNLDRYESGQREKIVDIIHALNESDGVHFCESEEVLLETVAELRDYIDLKLKTPGTGEGREAGGVSRKTLTRYRQILRESVKKLNKYQKQREIMGNATVIQKTTTMRYL